MMPSSLVHGRYVICHARNPQAPLVIEDGAVFQVDGQIKDVGSFKELRQKYSADEVLGGADRVVLPGFVNAHHHVGLTPFQLGSPDLPLELWIIQRLGARSIDPYLDTVYAGLEMIAAGITTVQHMQGWAPGPLDNNLAVSRSMIQAYDCVGMRCSYSNLARDQCRLVYLDDAKFIDSLPEELRGEASAFVRQYSLTIPEIVALFEELRSEHPPIGRSRVQLAPANLHWCSDKLLGEIGDLSRKYDVPMHFHLLETRYQKEYARRHGDSAVRYLHKLGLLGSNMTLGHAVWVDEEEIGWIAQSGSCICHNCSSNFRLQSGIAPLHAFLKHGITVGLGIDEAGINDDRDMLQEMRLVRLAHSVAAESVRPPSSAQILFMATEGSAATTPFRDEIGALEPGKCADLVIMDWNAIEQPYLEPGTSVIDALIYRGRSSAVETVIVDGECIYRDRRFTRIDKEFGNRGAEEKPCQSTEPSGRYAPKAGRRALAACD